jgi:hypothetical protein
MSSLSQQPIIRFEDIQFCTHQVELLAHCAYEHLEDIKFIPDEFRSTYSDTVLVSYDMVLPEYKADIILNKQLHDLSISPCLLYRAFDIYCFNPKFYRAFFKFMYLSYGNIFPEILLIRFWPEFLFWSICLLTPILHSVHIRFLFIYRL